MSEYTLTVTNKRIWDFYNNNKAIHFEAMNLLFLDFMEKVSNDMSSTMVNTINNEILSSVKALTNTVSNFTNTIMVKLHDNNREYIDNMKLILGSTSTENMDKLMAAVTRNTESFVTRITNELPKNQTEVSNKVKEDLQQFQKAITDDIRTQLSSSTHSDANMREYIAGLETKIQNLQQPIYSFITANQEQITNNLSSLKESNMSSQLRDDKIMAALEEFLNKYRVNSNHKGKYSENMLEVVLNKIYPTAEVINSSSSMKAAGDFILKRDGKGNILIENKNYDLAIQKDEISKFLRDVKAQKSHGIFLSQHSGIQYKPNYFIEIEDGCVLIYLHNVEYSEEKIRTAVDIIDNLSNKLAELSIHDTENGLVIEKDLLDRINAEVQVFINKKERICTIVKEQNKMLLAELDELRLPDLEGYLYSKYASMQNQKWCCEICQEVFTKKASLSSHRKKHKEVKEVKEAKGVGANIVISTN